MQHDSVCACICVCGDSLADRRRHRSRRRRLVTGKRSDKIRIRSNNSEMAE